MERGPTLVLACMLQVGVLVREIWRGMSAAEAAAGALAPARQDKALNRQIDKLRLTRHAVSARLLYHTRWLGDCFLIRMRVHPQGWFLWLAEAWID